MAHGEAFQTHAEGEAGILVRINAAVAQHLGVHHAGAQHLDPTLALAGGAALAAALVALDVHLAGRLREGEVVGTEAGDGAGAVDGLDDGVQRAFQVRHGHALVHHQTLDLMEHGGVGGVHLVLAVHPAGGDDADGQLHGLHGPHLHGRGLAAEHYPAVLVKVEGVRPVPGGVALLGVELVEVVLGQLHLGAVQHGEAHADEDVLQLVQGQVHGVLVAQLGGFSGDGHIHRLGLQARLQGLGLQALALLLNGALQGGAHLVGQLAHGGTLLGGELAHHLQNGGELALLAQVLHPEPVQLGGGLGVLHGREGLGPDFC